MKHMSLKVARIGNSRGVRLPAATLERYHVGDELVMEERSDGILLRPPSRTTAKLSWEDTAREMAQNADEWNVWDATLADGLEQSPWEAARPRRVAETAPNPARRSARTK
jgi:antitoxin component of MazEF toxin-antitoxin module